MIVKLERTLGNALEFKDQTQNLHKQLEAHLTVNQQQQNNCLRTDISLSYLGCLMHLTGSKSSPWILLSLIHDFFMYHVGQTGKSLKTRFHEHFRKMKKAKNLTCFFITISKIMAIQLVKF